jgi:uncharacterized PurR-regulated membrane protein YhhQ (DUF165 family)
MNKDKMKRRTIDIIVFVGMIMSIVFVIALYSCKQESTNHYPLNNRILKDCNQNYYLIKANDASWYTYFIEEMDSTQLKKF